MQTAVPKLLNTSQIPKSLAAASVAAAFFYELHFILFHIVITQVLKLTFIFHNTVCFILF